MRPDEKLVLEPLPWVSSAIACNLRPEIVRFVFTIHCAGLNDDTVRISNGVSQDLQNSQKPDVKLTKMLEFRPSVRWFERLRGGRKSYKTQK